MSICDENQGDAAAAGRLRELLARQLDLYRRLERLSGAQRQSIETEDPRPLLILLSERQRLTAALSELNPELAAFRLRWASVKPALPAGQRNEIDAMLAEVAERLRRILDGDEADARLLAARKHSLAAQLGELDAAKQTLAAYGQASATKAGALEGTQA